MPSPTEKTTNSFDIIDSMRANIGMGSSHKTRGSNVGERQAQGNTGLFQSHMGSPGQQLPQNATPLNMRPSSGSGGGALSNAG